MSLSEELLAPIGGENPAGADLRYQPVYDQIKEARREDDVAQQGVWQRERKVADWAQVQKLTTEALKKKSKDLQLAAWLTEAMVHREGYAGFAAGLELMRKLLTEYWETMYPELEDGDSEMRSVPLVFVASKLDVALRRVPLPAVGIDYVEYKESTAIPAEDEQTDENKRRARQAALEEAVLRRTRSA